MAAPNRRQFLAGAGLAAGSLALPASAAPPAPAAAAPKFKLGLVTYNVAARWDVPTILRVCKSVGLAAVELRTTHRHGVEPSLGKGRRKDIRKMFADAGVRVWGCGTTCEFHAPDPAVV